MNASATDAPPSSPTRSEPRAHVAGCFVLMLVGLYLAAGPIVQLPTWRVSSESNPAFLEAQAWLDGRLSLARRVWDTAMFDGRAYSVHPPMFTLLSAAAITVGRWQGVPDGTFHPPWYVASVALPLPIVGFWAFQSVLRRARWSAVLTAFWLIGTPLLPVLRDCREGAINPINHALASTGVMLMAGDLLGRRRMWPAVIGLLLAGWSRPTTCAFGLAAIAIAYGAAPRRRGRLLLAIAGLAATLGGLATLNWLKFGSPLETGYRYIYDGDRARDWYGKRALEYGVFSPHFIAENAYRMFLAPPFFRTSPQYIQQDNDNHGVAIWMTCPLLLLLAIDARRWWRRPGDRVLMMATVPIIAALLMYHTPGTPQVGYFRYALDFLPVWLLVLAPSAIEAPRRGWTLAAVAFSAWYFHLITT